MSFLEGAKPQPLERGRAREAAAVLGRAFHDNPGVRALLRDDPPAQRIALVETAMHVFTRSVLRVGSAETIQDQGKIVAVSLLYPPSAYPPSLWSELQVAAGLLQSGPRRFLRFARVDAFMRSRHVSFPHFYLWVLGVEPEQQGRGHGSTLIRSLTARADASGAPCYLETDKPSSVRLYEKHGFVVQSEARVPALDFTLWFMLRAASRAAGQGR
jgi:ribosomal protein S18 acetylase RimI-like enzyme